MCKGQVPSKRPPSGVEMRIEVHKVLAGDGREMRRFCSDATVEPTVVFWMNTVGWLPGGQRVADCASIF